MDGIGIRWRFVGSWLPGFVFVNEMYMMILFQMLHRTGMFTHIWFVDFRGKIM